MANSVRRIIAAAANALREDDEDDFEQVIQHTRRTFRRGQRPQRGRKPSGVFKMKTLLLRRANSDFLPIKTECELLTSCGLGYSNVEPRYQIAWKTEDIENYIYSLFPNIPLQLVGFRLAKTDRQKKLLGVQIEDGKQLKEVFGRSLIVIIPNRDLPLPAPEIISQPPIISPATTSSDVETNPSNVLRVETQVENININNQPIISASQHNQQVEPEPSVASFSRSVSSFDQFQEIGRFPTQDIDNIQQYFEDENVELVNSLNHDDVVLTIPKLDENSEIFFMQISRESCVHEMLKYYQDASISTKKLMVSFKEELGIDSGGLTKELFNLFF